MVSHEVPVGTSIRAPSPLERQRATVLSAGDRLARLAVSTHATTSPHPHHVDVVVQPAGALAGGPTLRLAALGDSGMAGVGVGSVQQTLPVLLASRLADALGRPVHVRGYARSGARTADVLAEQLPELRGPVDAVVLMVGTNDVTHLTPLRRLAADTARLLDELACRGAPVLVSSLPEFRAMAAVPAPLRSAVRLRARAVEQVQRGAAAVRPQVHLVDVRNAVGARFRADPSTVSGDRFHPSARGYVLIADALGPSLVAAVQQHPALAIEESA